MTCLLPSSTKTTKSQVQVNRVRNLWTTFSLNACPSWDSWSPGLFYGHDYSLPLFFLLFLTETSKGTDGDECQEDSLADVNETISMEQEETMNSLFECTNDEDGQYIDLLLNPERYTGIERRRILSCLVDIYRQHRSLYLLDSTLAYSPYSFLFLDL